MDTDYILECHGLKDRYTVVTKIFEESDIAIVKLEHLPIQENNSKTLRIKNTYRNGLFLVLHLKGSFPDIYYIKEATEYIDGSRYYLRLDKQLPKYMTDYFKEKYNIFIVYQTNKPMYEFSNV
jgi:hypothetical protein